ncbi:MAG: RNA-guided endonuclease TnpB family protein [Pseudomonadota bacterium]
MEIRLSHKICLDPTYKQEQYFRQACGIARFTWNWALAEWKNQYFEGLKPSAFELKKQFNAVKPIEFPWMYNVTKYASQQPFIHLQAAFNRFFQGTSRYPKFKKRGHHDSFYIANDHIKLDGKQIKLPKLGWLRMREALRFSGKVISATISNKANKWFVSLNVELYQMPKSCDSQAGVGVDLGIKALATLSNGEVRKAPKPLKMFLKKLKRMQRSLARREKGSHNRHKLRHKLAKVHAQITNIRLDSLHKLTTYLTNSFGGIVIEDLNVSGMLKNSKLSRAIADIGFYEFRRQLEYKSQYKGNYLLIADRWFPSSKTCSNCGHKKEELKLSERVYHCEACAQEQDRDLNAALNLKNLLFQSS